MLFMPDEDILTMYIERDERAIRETQSKYNSSVRTIVMKITENREDTEECLNDTYMALWNTVHIVRPVHLKNYIIEIAKRKAYSVLRKKLCMKRKAILIELNDEYESGFDISYEIEYREVVNSIRIFLENQPEFNRTVFLMHYFQNVSINSIAAVYEKNPPQIKMILYRMRKKLKTYLEEEKIIM